MILRAVDAGPCEENSWISEIADKTLRVILNRIKPGHRARDYLVMEPEIQANEVDSIVSDAMPGGGLKACYTNISGYSPGYLQPCFSGPIGIVFHTYHKYWAIQAA